MYSNQILLNDKDLQLLLVGYPKMCPHKSKMADGCHLGKIEKLPYLHNCLTNFDKTWHDNSYGPLARDWSLKFL